MNVLPILVLVATVATAQQFGFSSRNRYDSGFHGNSFSRFENSQFQSRFSNPFQDDYYRQSQDRFQPEQRFQSENYYQDDTEFGVFEPLNLPSGARSIIYENIDTSFSCAGLPYGYYADVNNRCQVFHICNPSVFPDYTVKTYQYSMMCGEGTQFDQSQLTCVEHSAAIPCGDSSNYPGTKEGFGFSYQKF